MPDATPPPTPPAKKITARVVNPALLQLDERLLNAPLASAWQRVGAMAVDLVLIGALSLLAHAVLGLLTGATVAALGSRSVSDSRFWGIFRWVLIALGAGVMALSAFLIAGHPIVRTAVFNVTRMDAAPSIDDVVIPPNATNTELRHAITQLQREVGTLQADNDRLRDSARGNSFMNLIADSSRTLGLTFGWAGVYFTLFTALFGGRTFGKLIFRSRVVRLDGRRITAMDAFTRNGGYATGLATGSIGFLRLLWDPNNQAIQDKIAGTVVVSTRRPS